MLRGRSRAVASRRTSRGRAFERSAESKFVEKRRRESCTFQALPPKPTGQYTVHRSARKPELFRGPHSSQFPLCERSLETRRMYRLSECSEKALPTAGPYLQTTSRA